MAKATPVIMVRSLNLVRGGVTKASMKRANLLAEKYKEVIICTFTYQQYHKEIIQKLYDNEILAKNIKVLNFFEDMKPNKKMLNKFINNNVQNVKEKGLVEFMVQDTEEPSYRYYNNGLYVKYKRFDKDYNVKFVDHFDSNNCRITREEYDERGFLTRIRHMDIISNKPKLDRYFDYKGYCYLSVWLNPDTQKEGITVQLTGSKNEYKTLRQCQSAWFNRMLNRITYPVASSELRELDSFLLSTESEKVKKIAVNHTNHLSYPYDNINKIKKGYRHLYNNADRLDQIVFLTEEQKLDVEKMYGKHDNFTVIPHSYKHLQDNDTNEAQVGYNPKTAVTMARFHKDKRLNDAIEAFRYVVDEIPDAQYHIYGYGSLKQELQELIKRLGLEKNVFLKKYTLDPARIYKHAACSILTSQLEGFAMVLTESMSVGTPVVSYNIKYGPGDIIEDRVNGFLVQNKNKRQLAEKIIEIMENKRLREQLSKNAYSVRDKYSEEKYREQWLNLFRL